MRWIEASLLKQSNLNIDLAEESELSVPTLLFQMTRLFGSLNCPAPCCGCYLYHHNHGDPFSQESQTKDRNENGRDRGMTNGKQMEPNKWEKGAWR